MGEEGFEKVRYEVADGIATVTLDDPERRNVLSERMLVELAQALAAAKRDEQVRVLILTGAGDEVFCAGADLGSFAADSTLLDKHDASERFADLLQALPRLGKPSLCAANGHVLAGGLGLAIACDLVIAREDVTFGSPEIKVGAFPYMIMALIYRNVGRKKTNEMLLLGERLSAAEAVDQGLANRAVAASDFDAAVADWATKLAAKSPLLMRLGHDAIYRQQDLALADALAFLRSQLTLTQSTEDLAEGVTAFLEKRQPRWTGR